MLFLVLAFTVLAWAAWTVRALFTHYRQARCLGVPVLISPVGVSNLIWLLTQDTVAGYIARLPFNLGRWVRHNKRSWIWQFSDRDKIHQEHGPIIAHVTPSEIEVWIADKNVSNEILKGPNRALFDKPREATERIDFLGPHLMTACGETWKRHRRIVAAPFNQRNLRVVWKESLHQGLELAEYWFKKPGEGVTSVWEDSEAIAMNVMVTAGFGLPRSSHRDLSNRDHDSFDFHSALSFMVTQFLFVVFIPSSFWFPKRLPPFPKSLNSFFQSIRAFKDHLEVMIRESKASVSSSNPTAVENSDPSPTRLTSDNLLTALVHHSEEFRLEDQAGSTLKIKRQRSSLSDDEICSNLFGLAFAGHETTAHTLGYSLFLLVAHPHIQEWVAEEVRMLTSACSDIEFLGLDEVYPQLKRTRALMYETLRLFTPLTNILKRVLSPDGAVIQVGDRTLHLPPRAYVLPSLHALHSSQEYWGNDSLEWNPKRWISVSAEGREEFTQPSTPGAFIPWSDGPRVCPGARFSQVEFVGICTALLSKFRLSAVRLEGEDDDATLGRVKSIIWDCTSVTTLMIKHPERIPIQLQRL